MAESVADPAVGAERAISARGVWLDLLRDPARAIFVLGTAGMLAVGLAGLPLAIAGAFVPVTAVPAITLVWIPIAICGWKLTKPTHVPSTVVSVTAVLLVLSFGTFAGLHSSQHLLTDRDPGVYFVTASWLAEHGTLLYDTGLSDQLLDTIDDEDSRKSAGIYPGPNGFSYFQFQHLPAVSLAMSHWLGGDGLMFRSIALIASVALLGIFLVARRLVGTRLALVPLILALVHPAFLHFAKDAYSEWFAMAFAFAAFLVWLETRHPSDKWTYLSVGALLGAGTLARIDAWWTATAMMAGLLYLILTSRATVPFGSRVRFFLGGLVAVASIGALDLILRSPDYLFDLRGLALPLFGAFFTTGLALLAVAHWTPTLGHRIESIRRMIPASVTVLVIVGGLFGLFVRPHVGQARSEAVNPGVPVFQEAEGLALDPYRTYAEASLEWLARYQGHIAVTFAVLATGLAAYVTLRKRDDPRVPLLVTYLTVAVVYIWRPSITPDHLWALRRFLPIVLPLAFIYGTWAGRFLLRRFSGNRWAGSALLIVLGAATTQSVITGWPIAGVRTQVGMVETTNELCDSLPPDSVVLLDGHMGTRWTATIRTRCNVPVTRLEESGIVADVVEAGLIPIAVTNGPMCGGDLGEVHRRYELPERTLTVVPDEAAYEDLHADLTFLGGNAPTSPVTIPEDADAALIVEIETTWAPDEGYALIAALGDYVGGMWLQYRENGVVELWITTDQGHFGIPTSPPIDDGTPRAIGGYFQGGVLYGTCGGRDMGSLPVPGTPAFSDGDVELPPLIDGGPVFFPFEGEISVSIADVDPALVVDP